MSLIDPTVGQLVDRRESLLLKIQMFDRRARKTDHLRAELAAIQARLGSVRDGKGPILEKEQRDRMEEIHARMWHHVSWLDATQIVTAQDALPIAQVALDLHALNRERWRLVDEIDKANGTYRGGEKL